MQKNGDNFDEFLRICSIDGSSNETDCKDTLVLDHVVPWSLY